MKLILHLLTIIQLTLTLEMINWSVVKSYHEKQSKIHDILLIDSVISYYEFTTVFTGNVTF